MRRLYIAIASLVIVLITVRLGAQTCSQCSPAFHSGYSNPAVLSISVFGDVPSASQTALNEAIAKWNTYLGQIGSTTRFQLVSNNNSSALVGVYIEPTMSGSLLIANNQGVFTNNNGSANLLLNPDFASNLDVMEKNLLHELGHNLGFEDVYTSGCSGVTVMYVWQNSSSSTELTDCDKNAVSNCYAPPAPPTDPSSTPDPLGGSLDAGAYDPIVISLHGSYKLSTPDDPVFFDVAAGHSVKLCWTARDSDDAFLALDRNGNGQIDNGSELFGNGTPLRQGGPAQNGFEVLAEYDANGDGVVDAEDPVWIDLLLWIDVNHNGVSESNELQHITASSITAIELQHHWTGRRDQSGNWFGYEGHLREGKRIRSFYDIFFVAAQ